MLSNISFYYGIIALCVLKFKFRNVRMSHACEYHIKLIWISLTIHESILMLYACAWMRSIYYFKLELFLCLTEVIVVHGFGSDYSLMSRARLLRYLYCTPSIPFWRLRLNYLLFGLRFHNMVILTLVRVIWLLSWNALCVLRPNLQYASNCG